MDFFNNIINQEAGDLNNKDDKKIKSVNDNSPIHKKNNNSNITRNFSKKYNLTNHI